jgi:hypothetical protein
MKQQYINSKPDNLGYLKKSVTIKSVKMKTIKSGPEKKLNSRLNEPSQCSRAGPSEPFFVEGEGEGSIDLPSVEQNYELSLKGIKSSFHKSFSAARSCSIETDKTV